MRALTLLLLVLTVAGCKQKQNETCLTNSDCEDKLLCVLPANAKLSEGGTCQPPAQPDLVVVPADATELPDLTPEADMTEPPDATPPADMAAPADATVLDLRPPADLRATDMPDALPAKG